MIMDEIKFSVSRRLSELRPLGKTPLPLMPDGSIARLPVDQSAANKHQLNAHGWPPNNIQEYINTESKSLQELMLKNLEMFNINKESPVQLSDVQKAALCPSRYAQTVSEFQQEMLRLDRVRESFKTDPVSPGPGKEGTIDFDKSDVNVTDDELKH